MRKLKEETLRGKKGLGRTAVGFGEGRCPRLPWVLREETGLCCPQSSLLQAGSLALWVIVSACAPGVGGGGEGETTRCFLSGGTEGLVGGGLGVAPSWRT